MNRRMYSILAAAVVMASTACAVAQTDTIGPQRGDTLIQVAAVSTTGATLETAATTVAATAAVIRADVTQPAVTVTVTRDRHRERILPIFLPVIIVFAVLLAPLAH